MKDQISVSYMRTVNLGNYESAKIQAGIEFEVMDNFWLRTGVSTYPNSISGGFGLLLKGIKIDYGYSNHPVLSDTHQFSIGYQF